MPVTTNTINSVLYSLGPSLFANTLVCSTMLLSALRPDSAYTGHLRISGLPFFLRWRFHVNPNQNA